MALGYNGLPGFDPTFEGGALPARPTAMPGQGQLIEGESGGMPEPSGGGFDRHKLADILRVALPALAAAYSMKAGSGLDGFMSGFMGGEQQQAQNAERVYRRQQEAEQTQLQRDRVQRDIAESARRQATEENQAAAAADAKAAAAQAAHDKRVHDTLVRAMDQATKNPGFMKKVNEQGADKFSLQVPGLGPVNLKEAFDRLGVVQGPDGTYNYGAPEAVVKEDLVATPGPDGPTYQPKTKGGKVYERPRAAPQPKTGTKRAYTWKDDDPESDTFGKSFRIVEDEDGNILSKKPITGGASGGPSVKDTPAAPPKGNKVGRFLVEPG